MIARNIRMMLLGALIGAAVIGSYGFIVWIVLTAGGAR